MKGLALATPCKSTILCVQRRGLGTIPPPPPPTRIVATSSSVLQHSDGTSRIPTNGGPSKTMVADANELRAQALQNQHLQRRVEHQRETFEPHQPAGRQKPVVSVGSSSYTVTLQRPPMILKPRIAIVDTLGEFSKSLDNPNVQFHRFPMTNGNRLFDDVVQNVASTLLPTMHVGNKDYTSLHMAFHLFFNTLLPMLPTSGANSTVLSLTSFDVILGFCWTAMATPINMSSVGIFNAKLQMEGWKLIRKALYRGAGHPLDATAETVEEAALRGLLDVAILTNYHEPTGTITLNRRDARSNITELLRTFSNPTPCSSEHSKMVRAVADELMLALYIVPLVVVQQHGSIGLGPLCERLMASLASTGVQTTVEQSKFIREAVHRCVTQRPDLFASIKAKSTPDSMLTIKFGLAATNQSSNFLHRPTLVSLTGAAIRAALWHSVLPSAFKYCLLIDGLKNKNGPVTAPPLEDEWSSIDAEAQGNEPPSSAKVIEPTVAEFDSFALKQYFSRGYNTPATHQQSWLGPQGSPLLHVLIRILLGPQTSDATHISSLSALLPSDKASTALAATIVAAATATGPTKQLLAMTMDDIRTVLIRWLLCGVTTEHVFDKRSTCGSFTSNLALGMDIKSCPMSLLKNMRDSVLAEATLPMALWTINAGACTTPASLPEDSASVSSKLGDTRPSMEYIEASAVLELEEEDFEEMKSSPTSTAAPTKRLPYAMKRMIDYNSTLSDVEVAERIRISLRGATWEADGISLNGTLPLSVLAKTILWNSYASTSTRNLRKFISFFPEHFELFIVGAKDVWARMAPNAPAGGPIVPPLPSDIPRIPHGTNHPNAQAPPVAGIKQGDLMTLSKLVAYLRPLLHVQMLSAMSKIEKPTRNAIPVQELLEMPAEVFAQIGAEDREFGRVALGFTVRELADLITANPKRLRLSLMAMPRSLITLVPTLSIAAANYQTNDPTTTVLEQRDENSIIVLGHSFYNVEFMRYLLLPNSVLDSAQKSGLMLWRKLHRIADSNAVPATFNNWETLCAQDSWKGSVTDLEMVLAAPSFIFNQILTPLLSLKFETAAFAAGIKLVSQDVKKSIEESPTIGTLKKEIVAFVETRSLEQTIGWREPCQHKNVRSQVMTNTTLEKRLQINTFNDFIKKYRANPTTEEDMKAQLSVGRRGMPALRTLHTDRQTNSGSSIIVIVDRKSADPSADAKDLSVTIRSAPTQVDIAMAELFKKRVDKRLAALPSISLASVRASMMGEAGKDSAPRPTVMHNQSHAGMARFPTAAESIAAPIPPTLNAAPNSAAPPPPVINFNSSHYYYGVAMPFTHFLAEAKRRCIPHRRYFDPLIQFIADTTFAIFDVVLPALDVQNSGGANRMERFAQVSGYANKCQQKVGSIESFIAFMDGLFVEAMGTVSQLPEHKGEGYVREFRGRVTRRMLYTRFFRPLLADITATVEINSKMTAQPKGSTPPPIGKGNFSRSSPQPVPPSQQGISVDEIAAACQYDYLFQARFGPLSALLMDFDEFRLMPVTDQATNNQRSDCYVAANASMSAHVDYRATFIVLPPDAAASETEATAMQVLLKFIIGLRTASPKPLPPGIPQSIIPIQAFLSLISSNPQLYTLLGACVSLLPSSGRVLSAYLDAVTNAAGQPVPSPTLAMLRQFVEGLVALFPLHIQLVLEPSSNNGPRAVSVSMPVCPLPPAWVAYQHCTLQPALAPLMWQAMSAKCESTSIPIADLERCVSWLRDSSKPFPAIPLAKAPINSNATIPLMPLLHRYSEQFQQHPDMLPVEVSPSMESCVIRLPQPSGDRTAVVEAHGNVNVSYFRTEPQLRVTETCAIRRMCYGAEQLTLIASGFDPVKVRTFRLMYAALLSNKEIDKANAIMLLKKAALKDILRLDEGGALLPMPLPSSKDMPATSEAQHDVAPPQPQGHDDTKQMDAFYSRQQWHASRHQGVMNEAHRRKVLFGEAAITEGPLPPITESRSREAEEAFEEALARQQALAEQQVHGRSTLDTLVTSGQADFKKISSAKTDNIPTSMDDATLEALLCLPLGLLAQLLALVPASPVSLAELSRVVGIPTEPLYWTLRAIQRLSQLLITENRIAKYELFSATRLEVQITFDRLDALVWVS